MKVQRWQHEFDVALRAVRDATVLARAIRQHTGEASVMKADASPVTVADFAVQAFIADRLAATFPHDPLVAEEDAASLRTTESTVRQLVFDAMRHVAPHLTPEAVLDAIDRGRAAPVERFWTLDPIDGTQGFVRGDQYVVALALVVGGRVEVAVLGCPRLTLDDRATHEEGSIACAVRHSGAYEQPLAGGALAPLRVSGCADPRAALILRSFEPDHIDLPTFHAMLADLGSQRAPILMDSQAKQALIAAGRADVMVRFPVDDAYCEKIWDQAAGSLIVEEAGGRVTDVFGAPLSFETGRFLIRNRGVVVSNGRLHAAVLAALRHVIGKTRI